MVDRILWLLLAAGHALPILPAFRPDMLTRLYGLSPTGDVAVLMRHRGMLFLAVAIVAIWCAFQPDARRLGLVVVATSLLGFLALYLIGAPSPALRTIAAVDAVMIPVLGLLAVREWQTASG